MGKAQTYIKFSGIGFQMMLTIAAGTLLGHWVDGLLPKYAPLFTVGLSMLSVVGSMVVVIRQVRRELERQEQEDRKDGQA